MPDVVLQTEGLTRAYRVGRSLVTALNGVSISVERGEFIAIMGPSGCGKSTLLNLLGGLDQPTSGRVLLDGDDLAAYNEEQLAALRRKKMGFIFQRHDLFPVLTALENVEFPLLLDGVPPAARRARAQALLEQVGLADRADYLPDELSGGQQQRVGIARALANSPHIMLADEPTGNLDSATAAEVLDVLTGMVAGEQQSSRLQHRGADGLRPYAGEGLTLVMVTHDPETAARANRILQLRDGRLVNRPDILTEPQALLTQLQQPTVS